MNDQTVIMVLGFAVNFLAIVHFFNRLEHRLTRNEVNLTHVMYKLGMKAPEPETDSN